LRGHALQTSYHLEQFELLSFCFNPASAAGQEMVGDVDMRRMIDRST
jgi:hypothetical protein